MIRRATEQDRSWVLETIEREWHGPLIERADEFVDVRTLEVDIAYLGDEKVGLSTLLIEEDFIEIITINSFREGQGVGTALIEAAKKEGQKRNLKDLRLFTTNDNLHALAFYQKRGLRLWAIHRDTMTRARLSKPRIPLQGSSGIRIMDEIELRLDLTAETPRPR